jgi:general secretion pathway protein F
VPVFAYKGIAAGGKQVSGVKDADSARALRSVLKRDGIFITEVSEAKLKAEAYKKAASTGLLALLNPSGAFKVFQQDRAANRQQVQILTRQVAVLLKAGVPLSESLGALVDQFEDPHLKRILSDVRQQVNEGSSFADALSRHPRSFEELYVHMVRAGEASGSLEAVLFRLAEFLDAQNRLRGKITSAMVYPAAMATMSTIIIGLLMVTVVPKVTAIFADMGQELPWNTKLLIFMSSTVSDYWWLMIPSVVLLVILTRRWLRTATGTAWWDRIVLKLWLIGPLARMLAVSRFAKTLATMLAAGVPLLRALDIVKNILGNTVLTKVVEEARNSIKEGESIAAPLKRSGEFPPLVTHMIAVGERTGELEQMLENVSESYDVEVEVKIGRLTSLLEPVMIMLMGGSVAFIVFSILTPILQMNEFVN